MSNNFRPRPIHHCASGEMYVAICGADTRTDERAGSTQRPSGVAERTTEAADRLRREQAENRKRFIEESERVKDQAALPVVWR